MEPGFVYIGSFNVYKLGGVGSRYKNLKRQEDPKVQLGGEAPKRIENVARVLAVGDFDIVALQEVYRDQRAWRPYPTW